ncbi:MAG: MBL fold metallo-hydrolase [Bacteroides sp.]|nr:MBL fold metallo-hydrolase [Bacteroides sp.]
MKLLPICSSSKGNSTYIGTRERGVAIDVGCSFKAFCGGLSSIGAQIGSVKAILVTHDHSDHIKGLLTLTKHTDIPVYGAEPTLDYLVRNGYVASTADLRGLERLSEIELEAEISCFPTPHDALASVGYRFDFGAQRLGFATDLGTVTAEVREKLLGCRTVFIEANYQPERLRSNPMYPDYLKKRIASDIGHLSNPDSAEFCAELVKNGTVSLVLGHLSQENNTPELAFGAVRDRLARDGAEAERDYMLKVAPVSNTNGEHIVF